jgi:hypothetical protein
MCVVSVSDRRHADGDARRQPLTRQTARFRETLKMTNNSNALNLSLRISRARGALESGKLPGVTPTRTAENKVPSSWGPMMRV